MISILKLLFGYAVIKVSGESALRFLSLCQKGGIELWKIQKTESGYRFFAAASGMNKMKEYAKKTNCRINIEGERGLPFFLHHHKKRIFFFSGIPFCLILVVFLSFFIWNIEIIGTEHYTEQEIKKYLSEHHISCGIWKNRISCPELEEQIRRDFEDAAWVSCDIKGTCLTVRIKESIRQVETEKENERPNDVIALKDGVIVSMITRNGTPMVKETDTVKKGDILISGVISIFNEYDELMETKLVSADGDVKAKTEIPYDDHFSLSYYEKRKTGKTKTGFTISIFHFSFSFFGIPKESCNYDSYTKEYPFKLGSSFYLPVSLSVTRYVEYKNERNVLTKEEAKNKSEAKLERYLKTLESDGKTIIGHNIKTEIKNDICKSSGSIMVTESIGKIRNIP